MNLKQVLMELGNRLVTEHGFIPAAVTTAHLTQSLEMMGQKRVARWLKEANADRQETTIIMEFTDWLNNTPEAITILQDMGVQWPVANKPR